MFCVTTAAILGLMPYPVDTTDPDEQQTNRVYLQQWLDRLKTSRLLEVNEEANFCPVALPQKV